MLQVVSNIYLYDTYITFTNNDTTYKILNKDKLDKTKWYTICKSNTFMYTFNIEHVLGHGTYDNYSGSLSCGSHSCNLGQTFPSDGGYLWNIKSHLVS